MRSLVENRVLGAKYCSVTVSKILYKNIFREEGPVWAHRFPGFHSAMEGKAWGREREGAHICEAEDTHITVTQKAERVAGMRH